MNGRDAFAEKWRRTKEDHRTRGNHLTVKTIYEIISELESTPLRDLISSAEHAGKVPLVVWCESKDLRDRLEEMCLWNNQDKVTTQKL